MKKEWAADASYPHDGSTGEAELQDHKVNLQ